jgi:hypothetical protein
MFNRLSKGSSYFISGVQKQVLPLRARTSPSRPRSRTPPWSPRREEPDPGGPPRIQGRRHHLFRDLGKILTAALADADDMFKNAQAGVLQRSGLSESEIAAIAEERSKADAAPASAEDKKTAEKSLRPRPSPRPGGPCSIPPSRSCRSRSSSRRPDRGQREQAWPGAGYNFSASPVRECWTTCCRWWALGLLRGLTHVVRLRHLRPVRWNGPWHEQGKSKSEA